MVMSVRQLKRLLETLPEDSIVVLSKDGEGNGFSPLDSHCEGYYEPTCTWAGDFVDAEDGDYDEDDLARMEKAVVLWPTN